MTAQKIYNTDRRIDIADILFENRNKAYGAYDLRKHYDERMNKSMLITLSIFVLLFMSTMVFMSNKVQPISFGGKPGKPEIDIQPARVPATQPRIPTRPATASPAAPRPNPNQADFRVVNRQAITLLTPDSIRTPETITPITSPTNGIASTDPGTTTSSGQPQSGSGGTTQTTFVVTKTVTFAEYMPKFPGGDDALQEYLRKHIKFTPAAINDHAEGEIFISFTIGVDGTAEDVKVIRDDMGYGCAQNAIDVIKNMPAWSPGSDNGHLVRVQMTLPITYKTY